MLICHLCIFFGEGSVQILCPFLNPVVSFFIVEFREFFAYFEYQSFVKYVFYKYFLPNCGLSCHSGSVFCRSLVNFSDVQHQFFLHGLRFSYLKSHRQTQCYQIFSYVIFWDFIHFCFKLRCLNHFELISCKVLDLCLNSFCLVLCLRMSRCSSTIC